MNRIKALTKQVEYWVKDIMNMKLLLKISFILALIAGGLLHAADPIKTSNVISSIRSSTNGDSTRIVIEMNAAANTELSFSAQPARLVLDFPILYGWQIPSDAKYANLIRGVRYGRYDDKTFRVVFDLNNDISLERAFIIPPGNATPNYRFVIDIKNSSRVSSLPSSKILVLAPDKFPNENKALNLDTLKPSSNKSAIDPNPLSDNHFGTDSNKDTEENPSTSMNVDGDDYDFSLSSAETKGGAVVVLDPGHGGKDPGAITSDVFEKNITLNIATLVRKELLKNPELTVFLTRVGDYFIPLQDRTRFAKSKNADLFMSIHADKAPNVNARGLSVYTLSDKASDKEAELLAKNENGASILSGVNFSKEDADVSNILINLVQRETMNQATKVANILLNNVKSNVVVLERPHRSAGFVVLKSPDIPSLLIELGFLSNKDDLSQLQDSKYSRNLASSLASSIENYLWTVGKLKKQPESVKRRSIKRQYAIYINDNSLT